MATFFPPFDKELKEKEYIIAFLDFLGAKEKMKSQEESSLFLKKINKIYADMYSSMDNVAVHGIVGVERRIFSDNIILAHEVEKNENEMLVAVFDLLKMSSVFQWRALLEGFLVRGAIVIGRLFINREYIYGDALVRAYEIESSCAIYPRIIVDKSVFSASKPPKILMECPAFANMLQEDFDGEYFLKFFEPLSKNMEKGFDMENMKKIRDVISFLLRINSGNRKIRMKLSWLAIKFDEFYKDSKKRDAFF